MVSKEEKSYSSCSESKNLVPGEKSGTRDFSEIYIIRKQPFPEIL
ncbi:hypothetical protein BSG1_16530 [Bacillus sp. SG-1]|nr:hypothetical protein BSG1_16530 [Bacillus sp. SG-1]